MNEHLIIPILTKDKENLLKQRDILLKAARQAQELIDGDSGATIYEAYKVLGKAILEVTGTTNDKD